MTGRAGRAVESSGDAAADGEPPHRHGDPPPAPKRVLRRALLAARRALPADELARRAAALQAEVLTLAAGIDSPVFAYRPLGPEPGGADLPDVLRAAGHKVLLPVVPDEPGPLRWAVYTGFTTAVGRLGLQEPTGERRGPEVLATASLILVPGLAADRRGARLGRGGGYYDRSLPLTRPGAALVILLHDEELLDAVPRDPHDHPVTAAVLPGAGTVPLG